MNISFWHGSTPLIKEEPIPLKWVILPAVGDSVLIERVSYRVTGRMWYDAEKNLEVSVVPIAEEQKEPEADT